jgi:hypothetical protein
MARAEPIQFAIGDILKLRKPHPCGGYDWTVVRLGADIGLKCQVCGRRVLLPRREVERRLKLFVARAEEGAPVFEDVGAVSNASPNEPGT